MRIVFFILIFYALNLPCNAQTADFTFTTNNGQTCSPVTTNFTSTVTGSPLGYLWNFGNGAQSNTINPSYTYIDPGTYDVTLTVVFTEQVVKVVKQIIINPSFSFSLIADRNSLCKPGIINFTAVNGGNVNTYNWNLGDGSANVVTTGNSLAHTFSNFGNYNIAVAATQNTGCTASSVISVGISQPPITASISQTGGCVPVAINFGANVSVLNNGSVTNYKWDYGDGSPVSNTTTNISRHVYNVPHVGYAPSVTITTDEGCTNSVSFGSVAFGTPATVTASSKIDTICHADTMVIIATSATTNLFNMVWGDGTNTFTGSPAKHNYLSLGAQTIMVSGYDNGCMGTAVPIPVFIKGVIASYSYSNNCTNDNLFQFKSTSQGLPTSIFWDFGDGSTNKDSTSINHEFSSDGTYMVNMTIEDSVSGCKESYAKTLYLATPSLIANKTIVCRGDTVTFSVKSDYPNPLANYTWSIDGGKYGATDSSHIAIKVDSLGVFRNSVLVNNGLGYCITTINQANTLTVRGPDPSFSIPSVICLNASLQANNLTQPILNKDSVKSWQWNFGATTKTDSNYQPAPYTYAGAGYYNVTLKATNQYNCTYSTTKLVQINPVPFVLSLPHDDTICLGQKANLMAYHFDPLNWSPTALVSCATCDSISVMPTSDTQFIATTTNSYGCVTQDTSNIKVYKPFKATASFLDTAICFNDTVQLHLGPSDEKIIWSPAVGLSRNDVLDPLAFPKQTTNYTAILYDTRGCFTDTAHLRVLVNPLPIVDAGPDAKYPYNSSYLFQPTYSPNAVAFEWSPAIDLSCVTCAVPQGIADFSETYTVKVTSDSGCVAKDDVAIYVECMGANLLMPTAFSPGGLNNIYYPFGRGMKTITNFVIYNRLGQLVYQKTNFPPNDKSYGWDGRANAVDQPAGTYVYMVESICDLGLTVSQKGTFVLIR